MRIINFKLKYFAEKKNFSWDTRKEKWITGKIFMGK